MENALIKVEALPKTKEEQKVFAREIIDAVQNGEVNPLQLDVYLKSIEETIDRVRKDADVKTAILTESAKYAEKTFNAFGAEITKFTRTTFDYEACGDSVWDGLRATEKQTKASLKEREGLLKNIPQGQQIASSDTGEIIYAPQPKTIEGLQIKIK